MQLLCIDLLAFSQDVNPGSITKQITDFKNGSSVDYATGIINYNIPLFKSTNDDISLPFTLSYNADGIKVDEKPGFAGIGWNLSYGAGAISRTLRGVSADEDRLTGILNNPIPEGVPGTPAYDEYLEKVNSGKIDSESDIFTLNIQGSAIKFILIKVASEIRVKTLSKTDVVIQPIIVFDAIQKWIVKDGGGNSYEFIATKNANIHTNTNTPFTSKENQVITSWMIDKISYFNKKEILFKYAPEEYLEIEGFETATVVDYNPVFRVPNLNDYTLRGNLNSLINNDASASEAITKINYQLKFIEDNAKQAVKTAQLMYQGDSLLANRINHFVLSPYIAAYNFNKLSIGPILVQKAQTQNAITNILTQMYLPVDKPRDVINEGRERIFTNKLIKQIILPDGIIDVTYRLLDRHSHPYYVYSKIEYRNNANELIAYITFGVNNVGFLKDVQWRDSNGETVNALNFDYYLEEYNAVNNLSNISLKSNAVDFWGYYNGKESNNSRFPVNPGYVTLGGQNGLYAPVFFGGVYSNYGSANRDPDINYSIARSLKSVKNQQGGNITFTYEGNEIYSADVDKNIAIGGLRIKNVVINDGFSNLVTSYKYAFPKATDISVNRSTGRLNEWAKKIYQWSYLFYQGADSYSYEQPAYIGTIYDDDSNNGVLYHYIEEVNQDGSATGYKFAEVPAENFTLNEIQPFHNTQLDRVLLAKIDYNANGKIVALKRNKYGFATQYLGDRKREFDLLKSGYMFFENLTEVTPEVIKQIKKEPVHFNHDDLLLSFPNNINANYTINYGNQTFAINPYNSYYLPNYPKREIHTQLSVPYTMLIGSPLLLKEEETLMFSDYDLILFNNTTSAPSIPNERPYLFDKVSRYTGVNRISDVKNYTYDPLNYLYLMTSRRKSSSGTITLIKNKFVLDYNLNASHPITLMKQLNCINKIVETQTWKSLDNGITFKLANGETNEFGVFKVDAKDYILPTKAHVIQKTKLIDLSTLGYSETPSNAPGYSSHFWENNALYKPEEIYSWKIINGIPKLEQKINRIGLVNAIAKYNVINGLKIFESADEKSNTIFASDQSPFMKHDYYAAKYGKFKYAKFSTINSAITFSYLSSLPFSQLIFPAPLPSPTDRVDYYQLAKDANLALNNLSTQSPSDYATLTQYPLFNDFVKLFRAISDKQSAEEISPTLNRCKYDFNQAYYYKQDYSQIVNLMYNHNMNAHAMWGIINMLLDYLKGVNSSRPPYIDLKNFESIYNTNSVPSYLEDQIFEVNVNSDILSNRYLNLYYLVDSTRLKLTTSTTFKVRVLYNDGSISNFSNLAYTGDKRLNIRKIDLQSFSNYGNINTVQISAYGLDLRERLNYLLLAPTEAIFKATTYLPDGKPYLTFDQNCEYTETFYDKSGRVQYFKNSKNEITSFTKLHHLADNLPEMKRVKFNVTNSLFLYDFNSNVTPRILELRTTANSLYNSYQLNTYPGQISQVEMPALNYRIGITTEPGTYTLKINGAIIPASTTGLNDFEINTTNLTEVNIDISPN